MGRFEDMWAVVEHLSQTFDRVSRRGMAPFDFVYAENENRAAELSKSANITQVVESWSLSLFEIINDEERRSVKELELPNAEEVIGVTTKWLQGQDCGFDEDSELAEE